MPTKHLFKTKEKATKFRSGEKRKGHGVSKVMRHFGRKFRWKVWVDK